MKSQGTLRSQKYLVKEERSWKTHNSDFNTYYKATIIKRVWYWHTSTNVNQWNIFEGPILNPNIYG